MIVTFDGFDNRWQVIESQVSPSNWRRLNVLSSAENDIVSRSRISFCHFFGLRITSKYETHLPFEWTLPKEIDDFSIRFTVAVISVLIFFFILSSPSAVAQVCPSLLS